MKSTLNKFLKYSLTLVLLAALYACDNSPYVTEILLRADFETDVVGYFPDKTLPGLPVGDELVYSTTNTLEIVHSPFADGQKALLDKTQNNGLIEYKGRSSSFAGIVTVGWNGQLVNWINNGQAMYAEVTDGQGHIVVKVSIAGQQVFNHNVNDPFDSYQGADLLGAPFPSGMGDAATKHTVIIEINYAAKKFKLSVIGQNLNPEVFQFADLPVYNPNLAYPINGRPTLKIKAYQSSDGIHGYIIDRLSINRKYIPIPDVDL